MSEKNNNIGSIDIEKIEDGDLLHIEEKHGDGGGVARVDHAGHSMVWLCNGKRLFYEDAGMEWSYEGIECIVHHGEESPRTDLFDSDAGDSPADNR